MRWDWCVQTKLLEGGPYRNLFPSVVQPLRETEGISGPFQQLDATSALGICLQEARQNAKSLSCRYGLGLLCETFGSSLFHVGEPSELHSTFSCEALQLETCR